jgi:hypothetical protein
VKCEESVERRGTGDSCKRIKELWIRCSRSARSQMGQEQP